MEFKYNPGNLIDKYLAPYLKLNDDVIIRSTNSIIKKLKFISLLIEGKYKEGIKFKKDKNYNITLIIPLINLDISSEFINIIESGNTNKTDIGLYQDYLVAKGYGYEKKIDELFNLKKINLSYWLKYDEIINFKNIFFFEVENHLFVEYIVDSFKNMSVYIKKKYTNSLNKFVKDFLIQNDKVVVYMFVFIKLNFKYLNNDIKNYISSVLKDINIKSYEKLIDIIYKILPVNNLINPSYNDELLRKILLKSEYSSVGKAAYQVYTKIEPYFKGKYLSFYIPDIFDWGYNHKEEYLQFDNVDDLNKVNETIIILYSIINIMNINFDWKNWKSSTLKDITTGDVIHFYEYSGSYEELGLLRTSYEFMGLFILYKLIKSSPIIDNIIDKIKNFIIKIYKNIFKNEYTDSFEAYQTLVGSNEWDAEPYILSIVGEDIVKLAKKMYKYDHNKDMKSIIDVYEKYNKNINWEKYT